MTNINKILKYLELFCWALAFIVICIFVFQVINTLFFQSGKVTATDMSTRLSISLFLLTLPLSVKGTRYALKPL